MIFAAETTHGHRSVSLLIRPDDQNHRHLRVTVFTDLIVDLFVPNIQFSAKPGITKGAKNLRRINIGRIGNGSNNDLNRRQPQREPASVIFDENPDEALERAENGPVQHHRPVFGAVLADV